MRTQNMPGLKSTYIYSHTLADAQAAAKVLGERPRPVIGAAVAAFATLPLNEQIRLVVEAKRRHAETLKTLYETKYDETADETLAAE
jgi:hypothetical protein